MTYSKTETASPDYGTHRDEASEYDVEELIDRASRSSSEMSTLLVHGRAGANAADTMARFKGSPHSGRSPVERSTYCPMTPGTDHVSIDPRTEVHAAPEAVDAQPERNPTGFRQRRKQKGNEALNRFAELKHDITFDTDHGPVLRPSDVQAESKTADKKIKRHTPAANRLHQGEGKKEGDTSSNVAQLNQQQKGVGPRYRQSEPQYPSNQVHNTATTFAEPLLEGGPTTRMNPQITPRRTFVYQDFPNEADRQRNSSPEEKQMDADTSVTATATMSERVHSLRHAKRLPKPQLLASTR